MTAPLCMVVESADVVTRNPVTVTEEMPIEDVVA
jgi:hypothetical protein